MGLTSCRRVTITETLRTGGTSGQSILAAAVSLLNSPSTTTRASVMADGLAETVEQPPLAEKVWFRESGDDKRGAKWQQQMAATKWQQQMAATNGSNKWQQQMAVINGRDNMRPAVERGHVVRNDAPGHGDNFARSIAGRFGF